MKCPVWSFQKVATNHSARSFLSSRDTKEIWSNIWSERDTLDGQMLEDLRKKLFEREMIIKYL